MVKTKKFYNKKPNAIIELTNNAIRVVIGFIFNNKPVILYSKNIITNNLIKDGNILDDKTLILLLKQIKFIEDEELELNLSFNDAILVLPTIDLKIYKIKMLIYKNSLEKLDSLVKSKVKINENESIINTKLLCYYIGQKKNYNLSIKDIKNNNILKAEIVIYTLPKTKVDNYDFLFKSSKINVKKKIINSQSICNILDNDNYLYVDIGSSYTTVSLIFKKILCETHYFSLGGSKITELIAEKFHTNFNEAEKIKKIYGYTEKTFDLLNPVIFNNTINNREVSYTINDLNSVIQNYFDEYYLVEFDKCLNTFLSNLQDEQYNFPIIIGGGGSKLNGLNFLLKNKYDKYNVNFVPLNVIGARSEEYLNCVGALF